MERFEATQCVSNVQFATHAHLPLAPLETGSIMSGHAAGDDWPRTSPLGGVQLPEIGGVEYIAAQAVPQPRQTFLKLIVPSMAANMATMRTASVECGLPVKRVGHLLPKITLVPVASGEHEQQQFVHVTLRGLEAQILSSMEIVLTCMEEAAGLHAGAPCHLGLAMPVPQTVFESLATSRGARLKELCREAGGPLRIDFENGRLECDVHGLLLISGFSGPLRVALVRLWQLLQEVDNPASGGCSGSDQNLLVNASPMAPHDAAVVALPAHSMAAVDENLLLWLGSLDGGRGDLLVYQQRLSELIEDTSELHVVARGPQGEVPNTQFFDDLGVQREDHRNMFRRWFEAQFGQQSFL